MYGILPWFQKLQLLMAEKSEIVITTGEICFECNTAFWVLKTSGMSSQTWYGGIIVRSYNNIIITSNIS